MIPVTAAAGRNIGVLGLGRSGLVAARAIRAGGGEALCWDDNPAARAAAAAEGFKVADLTRAESWAGVDELVMSPGIPHLYPAPHPAALAAMAAGALLNNDVGLFFAESDAWRDRPMPKALAEAQESRAEAMALYDPTPGPKIVAITGANGKSTTTALTHHILMAAGRKAQIGGNIGRGVLDLEPPAPDGIFVLELSSYQIELARSLRPDVAVFLNLSPDHLDRHGGMGGYFAAKKRLFEVGRPLSAVIGVDEPEGRFLANHIRHAPGDDAPVIAISVKEQLQAGWSVCAEEAGIVERRGGEVVARADLSAAKALRGRHNAQNAAAAWAACRALGLTPEEIAPGLISYPGLPHRMERVAELDGVAYINDSKATNADAAEKALLSYDRIRWIAGGKPKEGGIESLKPLFGRIVKTYLIGEAAEEFARTLGEAPHEFVGTLEAALKRIRAEAKPGEVALLSPACASFDQFKDYEHRGAEFRRIVAALQS